MSRPIRHIQLQGTQDPFDTDYTEGANIGYKWFKAKNLMPLFPFGFGLSYTTFDYGGPQSQRRHRRSA